MRFLLLLLSLLSLNAFAQTSEPPPPLAARAWLLMDQTTGQILAASNPEMKVEPASLTKIMTSYVVYGALRDGKLKLDQIVPVSEKAWKAPGSRMFIAPDQQVTVDALLSGMVVQSGNDASIALAEAVAGSEEAFANLMNAEAKRLGLTNTHFVNATGLPDSAHMTTVVDLAKLTTALIRDFPEEYKRYAVKEFTWNKIKQPNRNRLLWLDPAIDGVKTGHTDSAGYCLVASRFDGVRRLTTVVVGTASDNARVQETLALLHYGARAFDAVKLYDKGQALTQLKVFKGQQNTVGAGFAQDFVLSLPKGVASNPERIKVEVVSRQPLLAPVKQGDVVATLKLTVDGQSWGEHPLIALADVPLAGFLGRAWDGLKLYFQK
ncbi:D-alanyl-D-alanine carboxypeptidase family protein [Sulfuricystis thermophila]|uniref:D-alanyl-D-alanine carboxypeptidase family protein n=1 Tax=Sulfuricystis thermophila TaxID=2496847 RepID=UPI001035CFD5|nr:D-alanyl-D-alanine carboxypeptidase family protein [Sulfuricystis thermophila]